MSVIVMGLLRDINLCDKARLSGRIGKILASIWYVRLISDRISPVLELAFGVFPSWRHVEAGVGAESNEGGGDSDSIVVFHV